VSSTVVAEMAKLLENTFRSVNIGMVNELALMCHRMKIDVWEVIDAAKTSPSLHAVLPGPGLGAATASRSTVLPVMKARQSGFEAAVHRAGRPVNSSMPEWWSHGRRRAQHVRKAVNGSRCTCTGVAYKKNVGDMRESPALDVIEHLIRRGASVTYSDRSYRRSSRTPHLCGHQPPPRRWQASGLRRHRHGSRPRSTTRNRGEGAARFMDARNAAARVRRPPHSQALGKWSVDSSQ